MLGAGAGQTPPEEPRTLGRTTHVSHRRAALPPSHRSAGGARGNLRGRQSAPRGHAPGRPRVHARAHARRLRTVMQASAARRLRAPHRRVPPRGGGGGGGRKGGGGGGGRGIREGGAATEGGSRANVRREKGANVGYSEYRDTPSTYHGLARACGYGDFTLRAHDSTISARLLLETITGIPGARCITWSST